MENKKRQRPQGGGMHHGLAPGEKAKNLKAALIKVLGYLKPYSWKLMVVIIFGIVATIFSIVGPKILAGATDEMVNGIIAKIQGTGGIDFARITRIVLLLAVLYLVSMIFSFIQGWVVTDVAQKVSYNLRNQINDKVSRLPLKYFDDHPLGDTLSRVTNDVDTLAQSLNQALTQIVNSTITVVGVVIMMFTISYQMTLIAIVVIPISFVLIGAVMKFSQKYFTSQQKSLGDVNGQIEEVYGNHLIVKAYNGEAKAIGEFIKYNDELYDSAWISQFFSGLMRPITVFVGNVGYVAVTLVGGYLAHGGTITIGDIQAFIQYVNQLNQPIGQIAQTMSLLQSTGAAAERIFEFLEEKEMVESKPTIAPEAYQTIEGHVQFDHVNFGYNEGKTIINDFTLDIKAGETVAIVGPTGAGKTTIVKLLMRFYELNGGAIKIDGHDINDLSYHDLRRLFGMVLQDTWLFTGTIKDNLKYGNLFASPDQIEQAAKMAYVDHFVNTLEAGMDTEINEDSSNISQGQKQLLTIARAFLKEPKILILDEATSSVDTRTEVLIQKGMEALMEGRTSFIIAHRLSTIRNASKIIVLNQGDVVEVGSHEQLMANNGFYANLYNSQFAS